MIVFLIHHFITMTRQVLSLAQMIFLVVDFLIKATVGLSIFIWIVKTRQPTKLRYYDKCKCLALLGFSIDNFLCLNTQHIFVLTISILQQRQSLAVAQVLCRHLGPICLRPWHVIKSFYSFIWIIKMNHLNNLKIMMLWTGLNIGTNIFPHQGYLGLEDLTCIILVVDCQDLIVRMIINHNDQDMTALHLFHWIIVTR